MTKGERFIKVLARNDYIPEPETGVFQFFPAEMRDLLNDFAEWVQAGEPEEWNTGQAS